MKLVWTLCFLLVGTLASATPGDERAAAESNLGSGYLMAFPMNDDQVAEESAVDQAKSIVAALTEDEDDGDEDDDDDDDSVAVAIPTEQDGKKGMLVVEVDERKDDEKASSSDEPQIQMSSEEGQKEQPMPFFKRPKIEELRKILGFPPVEGSSPKPKPIPPEKPKIFKNSFMKPKAKTDSSPLSGIQLSLPLRREDGMRPFGLPRFPLRREEGLMRPFGLPDIMQAASSILRRAIMDDNDAQDISKEDKDDDDMMNEPEENDEDEEEEEDEEEPLMIVPIPDEKDIPEIAQNQQPIFRRFPIPIPIPIPRPVARPRLPIPPLTPVAFFLPLAQQIMHSIMTKPSPPPPPPPTPRSHRPFLPLSPVHPIMPMHHPVQQIMPLQSMHHPVQQLIPIHQPVHHIIPLHPPIHQLIPLQQPIPQLIPIQAPIIPFNPPAIHIPILTPLPPQMPRPMMRPMPRRVPFPPPLPPMPRRMPIPGPMGRMPGPRIPHGPPGMPPMMRRPLGRPMPRLMRPPMPMPPVHPVLFMMATMPVPMQVPLTHPQQHPQPQMSFVHHQPTPIIQQQTFPLAIPDEERIILLRPNNVEDQDDDQSEIVLLYPAEEVEEVPRPHILPRPMMRPFPPPPPPSSPVPNPMQRIRLLRDLLLARQANRQNVNPMTPQSRASRVVEIVQQQLRIFPASHNRQKVQIVPNRADSSELHPVYVPFPTPQ